MDLLIACLVILFISGFVVDWILKDNDVLATYSRLRPGFAQGAPKVLVYFATHWFCDIFDALYGHRTWSLRRFTRSTILSVLFVLFSILVIGFENTFLGNSGPDAYYEVLIIFTTINVVADFISLQETRWVLEQVKTTKNNDIATWIGIDLILTSAVYVIVFGGAIFLYAVYYQGFVVAIKFVTDRPLPILQMLFELDMALPFFISTFATSIVWYMFVLFVIVVNVVRRNSRVFSLFVRALNAISNPGGVLAGLIVMVITFVFGIVVIIRWSI